MEVFQKAIHRSQSPAFGVFGSSHARLGLDLMRCPVCGGPTRRLFVHRDHWIRACEVCRHQAAEIVRGENHVATTYNDRYFEGGAAGYQDYLSEAGILIAHGRRYGRLITNYMKAGRVLDVGAAAGFVLKGYIQSGWCGEGIEPNCRMAEYANTRLGVQVTIGSLEDFRTDMAFDLVSMIQVIAHFIDPRSALKVADSVTRPGGCWLVETWNRESLTARLFGKHWHEYSPPSVLHWFSPEGLSQLAAEFNFREVARGRPSKWINGGHAKSLLRHKLDESRMSRPFARLVSLIPDGLSLPYPAEDLFWIIFQKA
jgi:SAM-dependent methyltransferase